MNQKVSVFQLGILSFFLSSSCFILFGSSYIIQNNRNDTFLVILLGTIIGLVLLNIYLSIYKKNQDNNLYQALKDIFPGTFGTLLQVILFICIIFLSCYVTSLSVSFIWQSMAQNISIIIITITFLFLVLYLVHREIDAIVRASQLFFYLFILFFIVISLGEIKHININYFAPILTTSISSILKSSIYYAIFSVGPLILLLLFPQKHITSPDKVKKTVLSYYLLSSFVILLLLLFIIGVLGLDLSLIYQYPILVILNHISFFQIEHLEVFLTIPFLFSIFILLTTLVMGLKQGILTWNIVSNNKIKQVLVLLYIFLLFGSIYIPHQEINYFIIFLITCFIIPCFLLFKRITSKH